MVVVEAAALTAQCRDTPILRKSKIIVPPLATLAFKLRVVGDTGLKTDMVLCRHGEGREMGQLCTPLIYFLSRAHKMVQGITK